MRLYERDNNIKEIRELEREEEAEMEILLGVKAKKLNERVIFYYLNEMINFCEQEVINQRIEDLKINTNNILKKLLDAQMHLELRLNWNLRKFGGRVLEITIKRINLRKLQV